MPMRIRVEFSKTEAMRYTGHLDLYRTWERLIRRAQLPLAYTQGFNPHPKVNMSPALPLGYSSECELIDILLEYEMDLSQITEQLLQAVPPGIAIHSVYSVEEREPTLQNNITSASYVITIEHPLPNFEQGISNILAAQTIMRTRRGKAYNLRPLIEYLDYNKNGDFYKIFVTLACREGATGRPDELLAELGCPLQHAQIHRTSFIWNKVLEVNIR